MLIEDQNPHNKSLMVSVLGKPNAGKSTLINELLGFDLSIVTNKPQTTRNHFKCIFTVDNTEIILVDTPGVHRSNQEINKRMNGQAEFASDGVDLNLLLLDLTEPHLIAECKEFMHTFNGKLTKTWIVFTKNDIAKVTDSALDELFELIKEIVPTAERFFKISSKSGENIHLLTAALCDNAIPGPHLFPRGDVSNKNQRFFATEYIREQAFKVLNDELPYELAVVIDEYRDPFEQGEIKKDTLISASILVNRPSQRAIVVGSKGSVIKKIGTNARKKIEAMVGGTVHLNLHVKVSPKWFKNNFVLDEIGLPRTQTSNRVWRKK
jgi:GTP-binding protein Era